MPDVQMTEEALKKTLDEAVAKGTKSASEEVKALTEKLSETEKNLKSLAEKQAVSVNSSKLSRAETKTANMKEIGRAFKEMVETGAKTPQFKEYTEGTNAEGGFTVREEFVAGIYEVAEQHGLARKYCLTKQTSGVEITFTMDDNDLTIYWVNEGANITGSSTAFSQKTITIKKAAGLATMTQELLDDSEINIAQHIISKFGRAFAKAEDTVVLTGTGTPFTGVLGDANVTQVTLPSTKTSFADVTSDDLIGLTRSIDTKYKSGYSPRFYLHQDIITHIDKLKDSTGRPLFRTLEDGEKTVLLGYPVELTTVMPSTTDDAVSTKFIAFGDLQFVGLGINKNVTVDLGHNDGDFKSDKKSIRAVERIGVQILSPEGLAVLKTAAA